MSAPSSRPVHPCVLSLSNYTRGAEFATWAYFTSNANNSFPNLVTALNTCLCIYSVVPASSSKSSKSSSGEQQQENEPLVLRLEHTFGNLAGSIVHLGTLCCSSSSSSSSSSDGMRDVLLAAFDGGRLAVLSVTAEGRLRAESLWDVSGWQQSYGFGMDFDSYRTNDSNALLVACRTTVAAPRTHVALVLGGGVAVVVLEVVAKRNGWVAEEPYVLPLSDLARTSLPQVVDNNAAGDMANNNLGASISTGFGDILSVVFLEGFLEPVVVLLHSAPGGRVTTGRLGREKGDASGPVLYLTALSVSVAHRRTAVLWCKAIPCDALYLKVLQDPKSLSSSLLCVVGANTLVFVNAMGQIQQLLAVNGFAHSTCPPKSRLRPLMQGNAWVKLAIQLDGSTLTSLSSTSAVLALRNGPLYILQCTLGEWNLLPTGKTLGRIGEVSLLISLTTTTTTQSNKKLITESKSAHSELETGIVFAASRLGDCLLLDYTLEVLGVTLTNVLVKKEDGIMTKEEPSWEDKQPGGFTTGNAEYDQVLSLEEDALYSPVTNTTMRTVDPVSVSDEEGDAAYPQTQRQHKTKVTVVKSITPVDILVAPGPIGSSCTGPLSATPEFLTLNLDPGTPKESVFASSGFLFPTGFGSSGSLSLVTVPGMDDRLIVAEQDCVNVRCVFFVAHCVLIGMTARAQEKLRILRVTRIHGSLVSQEVQVPPQLAEEHLLEAGDFGDTLHSLLVMKKVDAENPGISLLVVDQNFQPVGHSTVDSQDHGDVISLTDVLPLGTNEVAVAVLWATGKAEVVVADSNGSKTTLLVPGYESDLMDTAEEQDEVDMFYASNHVVAIDLFVVSRGFFLCEQTNVEPRPDPQSEKQEEVHTIQDAPTDWAKLTVVKLRAELEQRGLNKSGKKAELVQRLLAADVDNQRVPIETENAASIEAPPAEATEPGSHEFNGDMVDEDDFHLYNASSVSLGKQEPNVCKADMRDEHTKATFLAVCRQSSRLEVYLMENGKLRLVWSSVGCGVGSDFLGTSLESRRIPRQTVSCTRQMRFFTGGPTEIPHSKTASSLRTFGIAVENSLGDLSIYKATGTSGGGDSVSFVKIPTRSVTRQSKEQSRHHTKLLRKRMVHKKAKVVFHESTLKRFFGLSGHDGVFYAGSQPCWIVCERGQPQILHHRTRHGAPAGGAERPIRGFCSSTTMGLENYYVTVHERVGKVGSQRLTLFDGISKSFESSGYLSGDGMCVERIPLGVTVHDIQYLDDPLVSTGSHPLYALLVSRKFELDKSELNSDGLTQEEREQKEKEKEEAKIQKQVEIDLGGFDTHNEWVEEIERENCFDIDTNYGGAPPTPASSYSVWIVDAANNWVVVNQYNFEEYEYGLSMQYMSLSNFKADPAGTSEGLVDGPDEKIPFLTIGTGIVDHNGEDVITKGRVLLLRVKAGETGQVELSLGYEKEIFHGPVTSLSCLAVEGCSRLVVGAGADVNIEQWGNDKLTQVGFFRATMQILDIKLFKNFFLLSDAYDSLYFLIWRESDKSLTMLGKDYDPISVYAAGLLSRGQTLSFICHDNRQNLQFFQYAPGEAAARGGNRLVCRADCHLGTCTTSLQSHVCRSPLIIHSATPTSSLAALKQQDNFYGRSDDDQQCGVHFGTTDGGLGAIVPVSDPVFWRLQALQSVMSNALEMNCALNQQGWRLYRRSTRRGGCRSNNRKRFVIDGDFLLTYSDLPVVDQEDLAASIGSSVDLILDNLLVIQCGSLLV